MVIKNIYIFFPGLSIFQKIKIAFFYYIECNISNHIFTQYFGTHIDLRYEYGNILYCIQIKYRIPQAFGDALNDRFTHEI